MIVDGRRSATLIQRFAPPQTRHFFPVVRIVDGCQLRYQFFASSNKADPQIDERNCYHCVIERPGHFLSLTGNNAAAMPCHHFGESRFDFKDELLPVPPVEGFIQPSKQGGIEGGNDKTDSACDRNSESHFQTCVRFSHMVQSST